MTNLPHPTTGREIRLASRPHGEPTLDSFELAEVRLPELSAGQILVRNTWMSVDPYMRGRMNGRKTYIEPFQIGSALDGHAVGEVIGSESAAVPVGTTVAHLLGWREYAVLDAPSPDADWHLLAGDEAALPAIAAALEAIPDGKPAHVVIEVADASEEQPIVTKADVSVTWLHRDGVAPGDAMPRLIEAITAVPWLPGVAHVFVHGESALVKGLRQYFLEQRSVSRDYLSLSGYWRTGLVEDDFQAWKKTERDRGSDAILT